MDTNSFANELIAKLNDRIHDEYIERGEKVTYMYSILVEGIEDDNDAPPELENSLRSIYSSEDRVSAYREIQEIILNMLQLSD